MPPKRGGLCPPLGGMMGSEERMNIEIKNFADSRDLKSLKYIFVDSLDVDPTFVRYEEEYNYCRAIPGLLERHVELTPFTQDTSRWNEDYWTSLKMDLIKNFSDIRMTHMREVAKVLLADKVQRILAERSADTASATKGSVSDQTQKISVETKGASAEIERNPAETKRIFAEPVNIVGGTGKDTSKSNEMDSAGIRESVSSGKAEQDRMILEAKMKLAQENRETEQKRLADDRRLEQQRQLYQNMNQEDPQGGFSKKAIGIAIAAVAVIVIVLILLLK